MQCSLTMTAAKALAPAISGTWSMQLPDLTALLPVALITLSPAATLAKEIKSMLWSHQMMVSKMEVL